MGHELTVIVIPLLSAAILGPSLRDILCTASSAAIMLKRRVNFDTDDESMELPLPVPPPDHEDCAFES